MSVQVSIVIPAFNEGAGVKPVLEEMRAILRDNDIDAEIIVVDDGSRDDTAEQARAGGALVIRHRSNRGYGAALKTGIAAASRDIVAITDADGTYPARYLPALFKELESADMVVGARTGQNVNIPLIRKPAKWLLSRLANYVTGTKIPDLNSGLRAFRRGIVMQYFPILPDAFSWTTTITMAMTCDKYAVTFVPIDYRRRTGKSKIVAADAGSFAVLILRTAMLFRPLRVFVPIVQVCFAYGLLKAFIDLVLVGDRNISASALLGFMSALIILLIGMLGDAMATRLGRLSPNAVVGVRPPELVEFDRQRASAENGSEGQA